MDMKNIKNYQGEGRLASIKYGISNRSWTGRRTQWAQGCVDFLKTKAVATVHVGQWNRLIIIVNSVKIIIA